MRYIAALGLLSGLAAAQSVTTTAASSGSTDLPGLVSQLPTCAVTCISTAAADIGCSATDFTCLCQSQEDLIKKLTPCVLTAGCSTDEIGTAARVAPQICAAVQNNPNPSAVASASNLVTGALGTATGGSAATATAATTTSAVPAGAARVDYGMGVLGAAALVFAAL
ncbi:hypothetical protein CSOJ01_12497 [Colletotrichum sojae]|uniref:CFEM domain-containing protein n=1 Tax=Colletotrichum sojae TaxID=2175907 RepID=A0A8H6IUQ1_9PEZI|nr:hypothetical protein CSOJ01_12497 [Colletotrichum sojae]